MMAVLKINKWNFLLALMATFLGACEKDENTAPKNYSYHQDFDTVSLAIREGWAAINLSNPIGSSTWHQGEFGIGLFGNYTGMPAHSYTASATEYAYCDFSCGTDLATLSCWLLTPSLEIRDGDVISFWTRTGDPPVVYPDRLQVYANFHNDGTNVGNDANSIGDFDQLLFDINQDLSSTGYPTTWTRFEYTVSGVSSKARIKARIGFRYYVPQGGPSGINSNFIGIDDFDLQAN